MTPAQTACPICDNRALRTVVERDDVPVFQNVLFQYRKDALNVDRGDLRIKACERCGFVFNAAFESARARYAAGYDNNQTCSTEFADYAAEHVQRLAQDSALLDATIVEVGCGNGWFLEQLVGASPSSTGFGFDPAYRGPEQAVQGRVRYARRYFEPADASLKADVVICRHVIEHVADPLALLRSVHGALRESDAARIFFETPSVEWILRNQVIWDFFYEHCSYFSAASLRAAFALSGFASDRIDVVFGDQYLWAEATRCDSARAPVFDPGELLALATKFHEAEPELRRSWSERIDFLRQYGPVAVWGAGAKGVTFLNLIDPQCERIDCAVDVNPDKQHQFVPGTGHPVVAVEALVERGVRAALLMNPNYREENKKRLAAISAEVELVG